jgi:hypothetical protein
MSLSTCIEQLNGLVSLFSANIAQYKNSQYDEANTRTDFIDKFFALLDWDIANNQGFSESYRDVVREDKVKIDGSQKAPDYSFRIGGVRKFFVEAKKPAVNIKDTTEPAYQVRRYAYTAKLPLQFYQILKNSLFTIPESSQIRTTKQVRLAFFIVLLINTNSILNLSVVPFQKKPF